MCSCCCCFAGDYARLQETSARLRYLPLRTAAGQVTPGNCFKLAQESATCYPRHWSSEKDVILLTTTSVEFSQIFMNIKCCKLLSDFSNTSQIFRIAIFKAQGIVFQENLLVRNFLTIGIIAILQMSVFKRVEIVFFVFVKGNC